MRQLQYVAERKLRNNVVRYNVAAISLIQAVCLVQKEVQDARRMGIARNDRIIGFVDTDGQVVEF